MGRAGSNEVVSVGTEVSAADERRGWQKRIRRAKI
jgi:hypothetical protein